MPLPAMVINVNLLLNADNGKWYIQCPKCKEIFLGLFDPVLKVSEASFYMIKEHMKSCLKNPAISNEQYQKYRLSLKNIKAIKELPNGDQK